MTDEERARRRAMMKAAGERARARSAETDEIVAERARWMEGHSGDPWPMSELFDEMLEFLEADRRKDAKP